MSPDPYQEGAEVVHQHHAGCPCYHPPGHHTPQPPPAPATASGVMGGQSPGTWIALGVTGSFLAVSLAVSVIAVAIGAVALTVCLLILRSILTSLTTKETHRG